GLAAVVLLGALLLTGGDPAPPPRPQVVGQGAAPPKPAFPTQQYVGRGVTVNVPRGWQRSTGGLWVDFTDPDDKTRRVRVIVENSTADPARFMKAAGDRLAKSKNCAKPYRRVDLRDTTLMNQPAAELEYTCGTGETMRHGVWRAVISNGRAYSFYLTAREARYAETTAVFEEMVRSFRLAQAG
ncbi:MAG TPA: serine/threonine protein kinase, partial [Pilimelia sp.]|nr:serine/threonine protein kinase [Pilimelia sp.]